MVGQDAQGAVAHLIPVPVGTVQDRHAPAFLHARNRRQIVFHPGCEDEACGPFLPTVGQCDGEAAFGFAGCQGFTLDELDRRIGAIAG